VHHPTGVIAEDEPLLRSELREALAKLWPELRICAEATDGIEALQAVERHSPQVLFLDIQMPALNGLDVARQVVDKTHVVFITAYDQHALEAFEQGAVDYLHKPISYARLVTSIERLKSRLAAGPPAIDVAEVLREISGQAHQYLNWLAVPHANEVRLVMTDEICYLQADNKYTSVFTPTAEFLLSSTLKLVREKLDPKVFWQIHRSTVVNVAAIQAVHRSFRGSLEIQLKRRTETLAVSSAYAHLFRHL